MFLNYSLRHPHSYPNSTLRACHAGMVQGLFTLLLLLLLFCCLSMPRAVQATTVVPVSDQDLTAQAAAIVVGRVGTIESRFDPVEKQILTYITLALDEILKGDLQPGELTLTQVGGSVGPVRSWIHGNPEFLRGEKVLLFLSRNPDGSARVLHLYQGKFSVFMDQDTGKEFAYRALPYGVHELGLHATGEEQALARQGFVAFDSLRHKIRALLATAGHTEQALPPRIAPAPHDSSIGQVHDSFTYLLPSDGIPIRWFEPDTGVPVTMKINSQGDPHVPGLGFDQIRAALQAWNAVQNSSFRYQDGGLTTAVGLENDGVNAITFGDPTDLMDPPVNCSGTLAIGGPWFTTSAYTFNGRPYHKAVEGDVVFNDGWEGCKLHENPNNLAEVATHELGHVLGLGHSSDRDATMYAFAHLDGRGAVIHPDDAAGLVSLYPANDDGGGGGSTCTYSISPTRRRHQASGGSGSIGVATSSGCRWTATSNAPWITVTAGTSGSGHGTVTYLVAANTGGSSRTGTITVAGKTFTVTQQKQRARRSRR
ncbi:MAG: matrixin family metalloprotease [Thermodesulfobacteriota bacterium]